MQSYKSLIAIHEKSGKNLRLCVNVFTPKQMHIFRLVHSTADRWLRANYERSSLTLVQKPPNPFYNHHHAFSQPTLSYSCKSAQEQSQAKMPLADIVIARAHFITTSSYTHSRLVITHQSPQYNPPLSCALFQALFSQSTVTRVSYGCLSASISSHRSLSLSLRFYRPAAITPFSQRRHTLAIDHMGA